MIRHELYKKETTINDININVYDLTTINWDSFRFKRQYKKHRLTEVETNKFYLVLTKYYADFFFEDILYFINNIADPTDLQVGQLIKIPDILDIQEFIQEQKI